MGELLGEVGHGEDLEVSVLCMLVDVVEEVCEVGGEAGVLEEAPGV